MEIWMADGSTRMEKGGFDLKGRMWLEFQLENTPRSGQQGGVHRLDCTGADCATGSGDISMRMVWCS